MKKLGPFQFKDAWLAFFVLGIIMLNYPFLVIFNKATPVFGIPLLILYFFIGWPLSIAVIYIFSRNMTSENNSGNEGSDRNESGENE